MKEEQLKINHPYSNVFLWILFGLILIGGILRFVGIQENRFVYFDEGMWLNHNRGFVEMVGQNPPRNPIDVGQAVFFFFRVGIETAKPLWSFISSLRYFFTGSEGWYFVRIISALSGCLSLWLVYLLVKRLYQSTGIACLAAAFLAVLPSHVYYSQLGLQESFSTLFFLLGIYLYVRKVELNYIHLVLSGLALAMVFLSNYRMIISPIFVFVTELCLSWAQEKKFNVKKFVWLTLFFLLFGLGVGIFNQGNNIYVSFGWMFHQSNLAKGHFEWLNLCSYPYFVFHLETFLFGGLFFGSLFFFYKKDWLKFFPTLIVLVQMFLFSFSQEKAARFLCVVLPFMATAAALVVHELLVRLERNQWQKIVYGCLIVMFAQQLKADANIVKFTTDYQSSMKFVQSISPEAKVLSTQREVQTLFAPISKDVVKLPLDHTQLLAYAAAGYRYVIIDPQAYISFTEDQKRFSLKLAGYVGFLDQAVVPVKEFSHFQPELLQRFVFDQNESLAQSIQFLKHNKNGRLGRLKVYEMKTCVEAIQQVVSQSQKVK